MGGSKSRIANAWDNGSSETTVYAALAFSGAGAMSNEVGGLPAEREQRCLVSTIGYRIRYVDESRMEPRERATIGEGELWRRFEAE